MEINETPRYVQMTPRGIAFCDFAFRDAAVLGLSDEEIMPLAERLIKSWDGTETLLQMYQRTQQWPNEIEEMR